MQEIIEERRELSRQYYELKERLEKLDILPNQTVASINQTAREHKELTILDKEKIKQQDYYAKKNKSAHHVAFDRIARNIASILKDSDIPMSNKQIFEKLQQEYEFKISYSNLVCNVLPRINADNSIPVEKAYRGYWQYRLNS